MVSKRKKKVDKVSVPANIGLGLLVSLVVTTMATMIGAWLVEGDRIGQEAQDLAACAALLMGSFLGAVVTAGNKPERRMLMCLLSGGVYFLCLLCCNAMLFDGRFQGVAVSALLIFGAAVAAGFLGLKRNPRKRASVKKYRMH